MPSFANSRHTGDVDSALALPAIIIRPHTSGSWELVTEGEPAGFLFPTVADAMRMADDVANACPECRPVRFEPAPWDYRAGL
jgi:hypothetical protein